ncbi:hypothetical protein [Proteus columbae]|uniref:hypothetical protein n=1 Tax=Proteus columbae TaxID=1987580 RepID=UPI00288950BF|nr:hypothetical protein [Proteus columbae]
MSIKNYRTNALKQLILFSFLTLSFNTYSASFNCSKAQTTIEEMICKTEVLSNLDSSMASLYKEKKDNRLIELQKVWLSNVRNKATTVDELTVLYSERIKFLSEYNPEKLKINNQSSNRNSDKLKLSDFYSDSIVVNGFSYSTKYKDLDKTNYILKCTELMMIDLMNIWKKDAIKNNHLSEYNRLKNNIYNGLWNATSDRLERQFSDPRMKATCDLLINNSY